MVVVSKKDEDKAKIDIEDDELANGSMSLSGIYGKSFIDFCKRRKYNNVQFIRKVAYSEGDTTGRINQIKNGYKDILELNNKKYLENVNFYIELPYLRPIIPILEILQKNGIEYYIPPINEKTRKTEPTVKIFIDRENYDKYMNEVHKEISNVDLGIISVHIEKSFADIMLEGTDSPYIKGKDEIEVIK